MQIDKIIEIIDFKDLLHQHIAGEEGTMKYGQYLETKMRPEWRVLSENERYL
jgi:hypothetical protein